MLLLQLLLRIDVRDKEGDASLGEPGGGRVGGAITVREVERGGAVAEVGEEMADEMDIAAQGGDEREQCGGLTDEGVGDGVDIDGEEMCEDEREFGVEEVGGDEFEREGATEGESVERDESLAEERGAPT